MFRILFHSPEIPGNTGNAIRLAAITGAELHLVEPLGFDFSDAKLRRAGLDYHDLAVVTVHKTIEDAWQRAPARARVRLHLRRHRQLHGHRLPARRRPDVRPGIRGPAGDSSATRTSPPRCGCPCCPALRSLNLANAASIAVYEAWRQQGFAGAKI